MDLHIRKTGIPGVYLTIAIFINVILIRNGFTIHPGWYSGLYISLPVLIVALFCFSRGKK